MSPPPQRPHLVSHLRTEFGEVLSSMVRSTPGSVAAVFSDETGYAIDFVHDPKQIDEVDVQLLAAQIGQSVLKLEQSVRTRYGEASSVLLETRSQSLIGAAVSQGYIVALLLGKRANVGQALKAFGEARDALQAFVRN